MSNAADLKTRTVKELAEMARKHKVLGWHEMRKDAVGAGPREAGQEGFCEAQWSPAAVNAAVKNGHSKNGATVLAAKNGHAKNGTASVVAKNGQAKNGSVMVAAKNGQAKNGAATVAAKIGQAKNGAATVAAKIGQAKNGSATVAAKIGLSNGHSKEQSPFPFRRPKSRPCWRRRN